MRLKFNQSNIPLLIVSDAPDQLTGLGRIGRDLANMLCQYPEFRVGYLGRGGVGRCEFPWAQYNFPEYAQWGEEYLPQVWRNFSKGNNGIVMSLWDATRMLWFARPDTLTTRPDLQAFLGEGRAFEKWGYFPLDAEGIRDGLLPMSQAATLAGYDRVVTASAWGRQLAAKSTPLADLDWIPHGYWHEINGIPIFQPRDDARELLGWDASEVWVGCVMTNQVRKDWPTAFHTLALLRQHYGNKFRAWLHTDTVLRHWDLNALSIEYGVGDICKITFEANDTELAAHYSACDATMLPTAGEGFGFPIIESMACGTPCVTTDYAGGAELVMPSCRVMPITSRIDTLHNVRRAVLSGWGFARQLVEQIDARRSDPEGTRERMVEQVEHLRWPNLEPTWKKWFMKGIGR